VDGWKPEKPRLLCAFISSVAAAPDDIKQQLNFPRVQTKGSSIQTQSLHINVIVCDRHRPGIQQKMRRDMQDTRGNCRRSQLWMGRPTWVRASQTTGHASVDTHLDSPHVAASRVYFPSFYCHPGMKEIEQDATVPGSNWIRYLSWKRVKLYTTGQLTQTVHIVIT